MNYRVNIPSSKLAWQWKATFSNREYIFKWWIFHCYVSLHPKWGVGPAHWRSEGECCSQGGDGWRKTSWSQVVEFEGKKQWDDMMIKDKCSFFTFWTCIFCKLHPDISWVGEQNLKSKARWYSFELWLNFTWKESSFIWWQFLWDPPCNSFSPSEFWQGNISTRDADLSNSTGNSGDRSNWMNSSNINKTIR